ncbi:Mediator complexsubunit Med8fungi/metazoa [Penicillium sp. IBT 31633x]|nr:Mediator complexsubunit Med8fungi/metazoa [Penicillium sp. IBT 31633x]
MSNLTQDQIKVLEQSRQRLVQLTRSLGSLIASLNSSDPLPPWTSLQSQASIISNNLISVSEQLSDQRDLLSTLVAYPGPEYPGRTQAGTLEQLLRTKLDPRVEDWVARGRTVGTEPAQSAAPSAYGSNTDDAYKPLSDAQLAELWEWAPLEANQEARRRNWGGNYTLEEREAGIENVVTGLKRQLEDDDGSEEEESEEEEGDGDEMDVVGVRRKPGAAGLEFEIAPHHPHPVQPFVPLDLILRHMTTGRMP